MNLKLRKLPGKKARKLLGYKTKFSLDKSIELTCEYIKRRGPKDFNYQIDLEIVNEKTPKTWKNKLI